MALRWGILGLGKIAHKFCEDLARVDGNIIQSVGSRNQEKANQFAKKHSSVHAYGSYDELIADQDVDIIYIATPHNSHLEYAKKSLEAGKHVLCEKPLAVNAAQVKEMVACAKKNQRFLMEAFWSRFNPSIREIKEKVNAGVIGEVNYVNADFTFYRDDPDDSRMLNSALAGGSLLDMGVYPVFLAYFILGVPSKILASSTLHTTGVDLQSAAVLQYPNGIAQVMSGFKSESDMVAKIYGTEGKIFIDRVWHETDGYSIEKNAERKHFKHPRKGIGFTYEIEECQKCIQAGKIESTLWSHHDSIQLIMITDEIRRQAGVKYPFE